MKAVARVLLWLWWISWFGILAGFFAVGGIEYTRESSEGGAASHLSLVILIVIGLSWVLFFVADHKTRKMVVGEVNKRVLVRLLTLTGTFLAIFTILRIFYFVDVAPRVR